MAFEIQEPAFPTNVGAEYRVEEEMVYITLFSSSALKKEEDGLPLTIPLSCTILTHECCTQDLIETLLMDVSNLPPTFLYGHDCDMVKNLSRMVHNSTMKGRHGIHIDHLYMFIMVSKDSCHYNVVNSSYFSHVGQQLLSHELVQRLACESGVYSLPAGASAIERLKAEKDTEDDCAICMQGFINGSEVAKLPCSHVYHWHCILEWFVQRGTCPLCRFSCSHS